MHTVATLALVAFLALTVRAEDAPSQFQNKRRRPVTMTTEGQALVFTVPGGDIGGCQIVRPAAGWPKQVILRLLGSAPYYEGFHLSTKDWTLGESLRPGETTMSLQRRDAAGRLHAPAAGPETFRIKITKTEVGLEFAMPAELLKDSDQVVVEWVDFYR
ncbi:MAG: hypothetical protein K8R23_01545 [Chthoniobacter sp.]|nr:hypothetical protein [Chthoniobacter sp.]